MKTEMKDIQSVENLLYACEKCRFMVALIALMLLSPEFREASIQQAMFWAKHVSEKHGGENPK